MRIGSLCTGYGGLDLAVAASFDAEMAWVSDVDPSARAVLGHRLPGVPNLGDVTTVAWSTVPPVDILTAGYPCQPFSTAGRHRRGTADDRHLWPSVAGAVGVLRPELVVLENVASHLSLGFDAVLGDLARLGYDARWGVVRAFDAGACHRRPRLFVVAHPHGSRVRSDGGVCGGDARPLRPRGPHVPTGPEVARPADPLSGGLDAGELAAWGRYAEAIARHAAALGRRPPYPVDERDQLAPRFAEWMMMLPEGRVTDVLANRREALKVIGNGVVPAQAALALRLLAMS